MSLIEVNAKFYTKERVKEIKSRLHSNMKEAVREVTEEAKTRVPVRTGKTKASIKSKVRTQNGFPVGEVYSDWFVSRFIELGTIHQSPKPFLIPAVENTKGRILELLKRD